MTPTEEAGPRTSRSPWRTPVQGLGALAQVLSDGFYRLRKVKGLSEVQGPRYPGFLGAAAAAVEKMLP